MKENGKEGGHADDYAHFNLKSIQYWHSKYKTLCTNYHDWQACDYKVHEHEWSIFKKILCECDLKFIHCQYLTIRET